MSKRLLPLLLVTVALTTGCASISNMTSARTLEKHEVQATIAPIANSHTASMGGTLGAVETQVRYGITDHLEAGVRFWGTGIAGHFKVGLIRSEPSSGFNLSVDPGLTVTATEGPGVYYLQLPVLFGLRFLGGQELTVGPRIVPALIEYNDGRVIELYSGLSLALAFKFGKFRLIPEITMLSPLGLDARSEQLLQFGLGFSFGGS